MRDRGRLRWVLGCVWLLVACARGSPKSEAETELVVFAAASLREAFTDMSQQFRQRHPGVHVTFHFAGSQALRTQLEHGARADVFAPADFDHLHTLVRRGQAKPAQLFARGEPVLIVAEHQAATLRQFVDLARAERLAVGAEQVPIGRYTQRVLERSAMRFGQPWRASVESRIASRELNVRQVLAKVSLGEVDAGIVYRSDVIATRADVRTVDIPRELNVTAEYPISVLTAAPNAELARAWCSLALSRAGQRVLEQAGFLPVTGARSP